jgi:hypothetical protein
MPCEADGHLKRNPVKTSGGLQDRVSEIRHHHPITGIQKMKKTVLAVAVLLSPFGAGMALADEDGCRTTVSEWQPREAVVATAEGFGWQVRRVKVDDGCYGSRAGTPTAMRSRRRLIRARWHWSGWRSSFAPAPTRRAM